MVATFKERLFELYEEKRDIDYKIGREAFAKRCNISKDQLSGYLRGAGESFCQTLLDIAASNHVSVSWLLGETDNRANANIKLKNILDTLSPDELRQIQVFAEFIKSKNK